MMKRMTMTKRMTNKIPFRIYHALFSFGRNAGCHQRSDRSFFFKGYQFPVCARCTGVLIGYCITIPIYLLLRFNYRHCLIACLIMLFDWLLQYFRIKESTNIRRLITGVLGGFGVLGLQILIGIAFVNVIL